RVPGRLPRHTGQQTLEYASQPSRVGKHWPASWSASDEVDLDAIAGSGLNVGGTRAGQLDQIDLKQLQRHLPQPNTLDFEDGAYPPGHGVGLFGDVTGTLARGLDLVLAVDCDWSRSSCARASGSTATRCQAQAFASRTI